MPHPTDQPKPRKKLNTYAELGRRAIDLQLVLYPLPQGGYALMERDADGNPDFGRKALDGASAGKVADFLAGMKYERKRDD